jgi:hypothetical protein
LVEYGENYLALVKIYIYTYIRRGMRDIKASFEKCLSDYYDKTFRKQCYGWNVL